MLKEPNELEPVAIKLRSLERDRELLRTKLRPGILNENKINFLKSLAMQYNVKNAIKTCKETYVEMHGKTSQKIEEAQTTLVNRHLTDELLMDPNVSVSGHQKMESKPRMPPTD